ncbi:hypothetical protein L195_g056457, partial [Trifolium pratense]
GNESSVKYVRGNGVAVGVVEDFVETLKWRDVRRRLEKKTHDSKFKVNEMVKHMLRYVCMIVQYCSMLCNTEDSDTDTATRTWTPQY